MECVILAAGFSRRMGQWKPLLPYQQGCILDAAIKNAQQYCRQILLVVGYRAEELRAKYGDQENILIIENPHFAQGMFSSIQCAMPYIQGEHFFITLGDMPCIAPSVYHTLLANAGSQREIIFPGNAQQTGHPVLFPRAAITAISQAPTNSKMKSLLSPYFHFRFLNLATQQGILLDVDTPADYVQLTSC